MGQKEKIMAIFGLSLFALLAYKSSKLLEVHNRIKRLRNRVRQPLELIYEKNYQRYDLEKSIFIEIWIEVATCLHIEPQAMLPEDKLEDFAKDASLYGIRLDLTSDIEDIEMLLNKKLMKSQIRNFTQFDTIDDIIRAILVH